MLQLTRLWCPIQKSYCTSSLQTLQMFLAIFCIMIDFPLHPFFQFVPNFFQSFFVLNKIPLTKIFFEIGGTKRFLGDTNRVFYSRRRIRRKNYILPKNLHSLDFVDWQLVDFETDRLSTKVQTFRQMVVEIRSLF